MTEAQDTMKEVEKAPEAEKWTDMTTIVAKNGLKSPEIEIDMKMSVLETGMTRVGTLIYTYSKIYYLCMHN